MGVSTDAILFYGLEFGEEDPFGDGEERYEAEEAWNKEHGPKRPDSDDYQGAEWEAWRKERDAWNKTGVGINAGRHCSGEYPMYYIALKAHEYTAWRGTAIKIDPAKLEPTQEQEDALQEFCEKHNIKCENPGWFLVSYWG
jgi:hypothetical protein